MNKGYRSALAAISTEGKIEHLKVTLKAVNAKKYMSWLRMLRPKLGEDEVYLFVDNLGVHKTPKVMKTYEELGIVPIFNETYSPQYNPIEVIFSQVKRHYKEQRLNKLVNEKPFNDDEQIRRAFGKVSSESILRAIRSSMTLLGVM